jgi:sporulation protein YlmC with PRC-barrel domain
MLKKYLATALIGSALLAPVAFAETPAATTDSGTTAQLSATTVRGEWRASKVVGLNVYNANNEKVGAIDDLLTDRNGTIKAVVIGVGGFLGMGEHLVALPFDKIKFVDEPVTSTSASNTTTTNRPASTTTTGSATTTTTTTSATTPKADWYPDHAVFNATKDELKAMPEFKYSS